MKSSLTPSIPKSLSGSALAIVVSLVLTGCFLETPFAEPAPPVERIAFVTLHAEDEPIMQPSVMLADGTEGQIVRDDDSDLFLPHFAPELNPPFPRSEPGLPLFYHVPTYAQSPVWSPMP